MSRPNNQRGTRTYTVYAAAKSAGLANAYVDSQKSDEILREPCSYYGSATVPKWPQKQSQSIQFLKFSWGSMPPDPLSLACLSIYTFTYDRCNPPSKSPGYGPGFSYENLPVIGNSTGTGSPRARAKKFFILETRLVLALYVCHACAICW